MNPNWFGISCAAASVAAYFASHHLARKADFRQRSRWLLVALLLALPGASFAAYCAHLVEVPAWYYEFRSWRGTELALLGIGIAGGLVATRVGSLTRILSLLGVVIFVTVPFVKPFLGPFPEGALRNMWDGDVCLQSTYSTCGAASAASILKHYGITVPEAELAKEAHSYQGGTEVWYLARALHKRGLKTQMQFHPSLPEILLPAPDVDLPSPPVSLPAIVGVRFGQTGHFIAILTRDEQGRYHLGDPLRGSELISREELLKRYSFSGFAMSVVRP